MNTGPAARSATSTVGMWDGNAPRGDVARRAWLQQLPRTLGSTTRSWLEHPGLVLQPHLPFASLVVCAAGTSLVAASPS